MSHQKTKVAVAVYRYQSTSIYTECVIVCEGKYVDLGGVDLHPNPIFEKKKQIRIHKKNRIRPLKKQPGLKGFFPAYKRLKLKVTHLEVECKHFGCFNFIV